MLVCVFVCVCSTVLEKSEFKDESQFFRFYADEETEGTSTKSKQLQRNDFKLIENIMVKSLVVSSAPSTQLRPPPRISIAKSSNSSTSIELRLSHLPPSYFVAAQRRDATPTFFPLYDGRLGMFA